MSTDHRIVPLTTLFDGEHVGLWEVDVRRMLGAADQRDGDVWTYLIFPDETPTNFRRGGGVSRLVLWFEEGRLAHGWLGSSCLNCCGESGRLLF